MSTTPRTAHANSASAVLGWTLPAILDDVCAHRPSPRALNQRSGDGWHAISSAEFKTAADEIAAGLASLGFERGDRVALLMRSDAMFVVTDMGCLVAGLIDVPIYPSSDSAACAFILRETEAGVLFVSDAAMLERVAENLLGLDMLRYVVVTDSDAGGRPAAPDSVEVLDLAALRGRGRALLEKDPDLPATQRQRVQPGDIATVIYTSGTTGRPKGVMLTHENLSSNGLSAFAELPDVDHSTGETFLSFLPLAHVFQRSSLYAFLHNGGPIYFCEPADIGATLREVRPTIFATVPRVLERVQERIRLAGAQLVGPKRWLFRWALGLATRYELGEPPRGWYAFQLRLADTLVFSKWRAGTGGRIRYIICGGAPLEPTVANFFAAAGMMPLQGYGLTETSPVITFNRPSRNRAGTVGESLPGVAVRIAGDGEVLVRGPNVTPGYYLRPEETAAAFDDEGWFRTGDLGEFDAHGFLRITDRMDNLFKLSTGQYVTPQPMETRLMAEPLVSEAVVVGAGHKFATALVFPNPDNLRAWADLQRLDSNLSPADLLGHPRVLSRFERMVDDANRGMSDWSTIKGFRLLLADLTVDNQMLTPTLKVRRRKLHEVFADEIEKLYSDGESAP